MNWNGFNHLIFPQRLRFFRLGLKPEPDSIYETDKSVLIAIDFRLFTYQISGMDLSI